ncbi:MAG TPA: chorismate mutase [Mycobacterium sp.]|nr:chorismate mutase [Mycobacterium sp.]
MTDTHRHAARVAWSGLAVLLAVLPAAQARADPAGALTDLVDAAAQRLEVAEPVAAFKWRSQAPIEDPARVQEELRALSSANSPDPGYVTRVFGDQINATEAIEHSRFAEWKLNPAAVPGSPPDLSASRSTIDGLNQTMLTQIAADWELLHAPACPTQLDVARSDVIRDRQLDGLYQRALLLATQSYCQG